MVKINNGSAEEQVKARNALSIPVADHTPATKELSPVEAAKLLKTLAESRAGGVNVGESRDAALPQTEQQILERMMASRNDTPALQVTGNGEGPTEGQLSSPASKGMVI